MAEVQRILVVDDEPHLRDAIRGYLELHGYAVLQAADGTEAVDMVRAVRPHAVILDVVMPDLDGVAALKEIRSFSDVPVIMLTARGLEDDKVRALRLGADDYVTKPFSQRELLARLESVLRRAAQPAASAPDRVVVDADLTLDFAHSLVILHGREQPLTATEHRLLYQLVSNAGRLMTHETLLTRVWGPEYRDEDHYVRTYASTSATCATRSSPTRRIHATS